MENTKDEYKYLDLLERKLDQYQKTACCRTENTVVAAGAGSGKTQVLATRFAWLVMSKGIQRHSRLKNPYDYIHQKGNW